MIELADGVAKTISSSEDLFSEISRIMLILLELTNAFKYTNDSFIAIQEGETYLGKAKEELEIFYGNYRKHINTLMLLYEKAYDYSIKAIQEIIDVDRNILSSVITENHDDDKILSRVMK